MAEGTVTYVLGMKAKIMLGAAELSNVKDVTLTMQAGEADITTRANQGWKATAPTLRECSVEFQMQHKPGDPGFTREKTIGFTWGRADTLKIL